MRDDDIMPQCSDVMDKEWSIVSKICGRIYWIMSVRDVWHVTSVTALSGALN